MEVHHIFHHHHHHPPAAAPEHNDPDPRVLFARRFWGRRRFSDSDSQRPHRALPSQPLRHLDVQSGSSSAVSSPLIIHDPESPPTPTSTHSAAQRPPPTTTRRRHGSSTRSSGSSSNKRRLRGFLQLPGYQPHKVSPHNPLALPSRRDDLADALAKLEIKNGNITVKGAGHLARPILNASQPSSQMMLSHFLHRAERTLLVPHPHHPPPSSSKEEEDGSSSSSCCCCSSCSSSHSTVVGRGRGGLKDVMMDQRTLRRLESELFDTGKYVGGGGGEYITVLAWSGGDKYGTIALFEVDVEVESPARQQGGGVVSGLAARRRRAPAALYPSLHRDRERVVGVRPVAAMEDVPRQVLVDLRVDQGLKKVVLQHERATGRFRWTVQHSRRGRPSYARVWGGAEGVGEVRTATGTGFDDGYSSRTTRSRRSRRNGREPGRRERSSLRVEDARDIIKPRGSGMEVDHIRDADGVVATIPQFLALLHASRSIIETASSAPATTQTLETEEGERVRAVSLGGTPKGTRHRGRDVHVVVLAPDGAKWADERIFWTDEAGALTEMRQKRYRDVINRERARTRRGRRGHDWDWDVRSLMSPLSPTRLPRSARW
ncbi:hypothetical protein C8A00DRAFT_31047 [Chaetomidium leptoderma]|uniref:Uncharacterized protein n=1 Tax=Chaetomidium leptoderma TaxID=669021 RepID=A0AAN6VRW5_9PEZI|nr:hypothetical protein C8A00DRAFT_31047 [Chaetomidium leptoderma]